MRKGEATGPQRRARRGDGGKSQPDFPGEGDAEDQELDPDAPVSRGDDGSQVRASWDALLGRMSAANSTMATTLSGLPDGARVRKLDMLPLREFRQLERQLAELQVRLWQAADQVL